MSSLKSIYTGDQLELLDLVDDLRAQGLSAILPLPQLIVCGDQSSGKSSVLEAISGIPFPSKENLCTRFATEVVLRRSRKKQTIRVSIRPSEARSHAEKQRLNGFTRSLENVSELPTLIEKAKVELGVGADGKAFATDALRLEVSGSNAPQLTIVDLPGLIHSGTKQQSKMDVKLISDLVQSYMSQPRSIILAVVSAKNDIANQIVLDRASEVDTHGSRTLGIITKPDTLTFESEAEKDFISLAQNSNIVFKLGWHVLRNLDSSFEKGHEFDRDKTEKEFFEGGHWKSLDPAIVGISALLDRLPQVLFGEIRAELPSLVHDINNEEASCRSRLLKMGRSRNTEHEQRQYLLEIAQRFHQLAKAGIDGDYGDPLFGAAFSDSGVPRVRAQVQNGNEDFGEKVSSRDASSMDLPTANDETRQVAVEHVMELMRRSRGRELPGTFNPLLIGELFREYSSPWAEIAKTHVRDIWQHASAFLQAIIEAISAEEVSDQLEHRIINPALSDLYHQAEKRLATLLEELRYHSITYNHYFTDTAAKLQNDRLLSDAKRRMQAKLDEMFTGDCRLRRANVEAVFTELLISPEADMTKAAAENILDHMLAFYKTAFKRFVDDIAVQVIETEILMPLPSLFSPLTVAQMSTADISFIASEPESSKTRRLILENRLSMLEICSKKVQQHASSKEMVSRSHEPQKEESMDSKIPEEQSDSGFQRSPMDDAIDEVSAEVIETSVETPAAPELECLALDDMPPANKTKGRKKKADVRKFHWASSSDEKAEEPWA